jgi:hypothetical protein
MMSLGEYCKSETVCVFAGRLCISKVTGDVLNAPSDMPKLCHAAKFQFAFSLSDAHSKLDVMVTDQIGGQFFGMPAAEACGPQSVAAFQTLSNRIEQRTRFLVEIRRVVRRVANTDQHFFILRAMSEV